MANDGVSKIQATQVGVGTKSLSLQPNGGNVGIGTAAPSSKLHLYVSSYPQAIEFSNSGGNSYKVNYTYDTGGYRVTHGFNGATTLSVAETGRVGIGVAFPSYQLQLASDSAAKPNGGSWSNSSDGRIKKNVSTIEGALDKLTQLRGVEFDWINPSEHGNSTRSAGFIAQEVEAVFPQWISEIDPAGEDATLLNGKQVKSLTLPFEFDAYVVNALKELEAKNASLTKRIESLEARP